MGTVNASKMSLGIKDRADDVNKKNNMQAIDRVYEHRRKSIIIGLTGRTGSGCSEVAKILGKEYEALDKTFKGETTKNKLQNQIIDEFMREEDHWICFKTIEVSNVIFAYVLAQGEQNALDFLRQDIKAESGNKKIIIPGINELIKKIKELNLFDAKKSIFPINISGGNKDIRETYEFWFGQLTTLKNSFKNALHGFRCYETDEQRIRSGERVELKLYTFLMQTFGNNIRRSGKPFKYDSYPTNMFSILENIDRLVQLDQIYGEKKAKKERKAFCQRICIDSFKNPYEINYFREKYRNFYAISVNTVDKTRRDRLQAEKWSREEIDNLDRIEYPNKFNKDDECFYHQNIQSCLEIADIHLHNPQEEQEYKRAELTCQILRYIALMLHPGLVVPTKEERCMQIAYLSKLNSGCISRQVGAVITDKNYSVKAIGWNDPPAGCLSCNLRSIHGFVKDNKEGYSQYERNDEQFRSSMTHLSGKIQEKDLKGLKHPYCFKDVYNTIVGEKNQVQTRSLHAEENAFLQIVKYGGQGIKGGRLFVTASPCELCSKKSKQLGIEDIYYIDPYPGIAETNILRMADGKIPKIHLFFGAVGQAYLALYLPKMALKDELAFITGTKIKDKLIKTPEQKLSENYDDFICKKEEIEFTFLSKTEMKTKNSYTIYANKQDIKTIDTQRMWSGSEHDIPVFSESSEIKGNITHVERSGSYHVYTTTFDNCIKKGSTVSYCLEGSLHDSKQLMRPFITRKIKNVTDILTIKVVFNKVGIKKGSVKAAVYPESELVKPLGEKEDIEPAENQTYFKTWEKPAVNINYHYCIEWEYDES